MMRVCDVACLLALVVSGQAALGDVLFRVDYSTVGGNRPGVATGEAFERTLAEYQADGPISFDYLYDWQSPDPTILPERRYARGESSPGVLRAACGYEKAGDYVLAVSLARVTGGASALDALTVQAPGLDGQAGTVLVEFRVDGQANTIISGQGVTASSRWTLTVRDGGPGSGVYMEETGVSSGRTSLFLIDGVYPYITEPSPNAGGAFVAEIPMVFGQAFGLGAEMQTRVEFSCQWPSGQGQLISGFSEGVRFAVVGARDAGGAGLDVATLGIAAESGHDYSRFAASFCAADFTGEGDLNFFDVAGFIAAFNAGDDRADFVDDGVLNFFDVAAFIKAFNAGCP